MITYSVYSLSDLDGNIFYVGMTQMSLEDRLSGHKTEARCGSGNANKNKRINLLGDNVIINEVRAFEDDKSAALNFERKIILRYSKKGVVLTNTNIPVSNSDISGAVKIEASVHKEAAKYCTDNGYKLSFYTTLALKEKLERDKLQSATN